MAMIMAPADCSLKEPASIGSVRTTRTAAGDWGLGTWGREGVCDTLHVCSEGLIRVSGWMRPQRRTWLIGDMSLGLGMVHSRTNVPS